MTSQSPKKVSIQIELYEAPEEKIEKSKDGVRFLGKTELHCHFSPFPYLRASDMGKIEANFSGEILTSSVVLDHLVITDIVSK